MGAFTPFKRNANRFNYTPRYYDPAKEAREQRRAEIRGERLDDKEDYQPGKYIRRSREARAARRESEQGSKMQAKLRMWLMIGAIIVVTILGAKLYDKLMVTFGETTPKSGVEVVEEEEFNPYAPITIVPNDYVEE